MQRKREGRRDKENYRMKRISERERERDREEETDFSFAVCFWGGGLYLGRFSNG